RNAGRTLRRLTRCHDEARPSPAGDVGPDPLQKDAHAEVGLREELEVDAGPRQPRDEALHAQTAALEDRKVLAHHRHVALVEVAERLEVRLPGEARAEQAAHIAALLHRDLGDTGQWLALLVHRGGVADHEDVWVAL